MRIYALASVAIHRLVAVGLVVSLAAVACSADTGTITPVIDDSAQSSDDRAPDGESDAAPTFSVLASLGQIPLSAADDADGGLQVSMADIDAAADQARLRRPADPGDPDQLVEFFGPLTGRAPPGQQMRVFVPLPQLLREGLMDPDGEFVDEVGFMAGEVATFAALESPPAQFVVAGGVSANADLAEVVAGVRTAGQGEDFETNFEDITAARPLGRPLRIAERDGLVALSLATTPIIEWLDPTRGATLADNPILAGLAAQLDETSVVAASLFTMANQAYEGVGLGWAAEDGVPRIVAVFAYPSEAVAQQQLGVISGGFSGESLTTGQPMSELVILDQIEVRGSHIVATLSVPDDDRPSRILELLLRQDGPFAAPA